MIKILIFNTKQNGKTEYRINRLNIDFSIRPH